MAAAVPKPTKRAQVAKACQRCKRLQKGCSAFRPCQRCVRAGLGDACVEVSGSNSPAGGGGWGGVGGPVGPAASTWSVTRLPMSPLSVVQPPQPPLTSSFARQPELLPAAVVAHCRQRFFAALYPTIPIVSEDYFDGLLRAAQLTGGGGGGSGSGGSEDMAASAAAHCLLAALCAMVLLQVPVEGVGEGVEGYGVGQEYHHHHHHHHHTNHHTHHHTPPLGHTAEEDAAYGRRLFDEAAAAYHHQSQRLLPTLERVLAAFFLYAGHAVQLHHSRAFFFLREASTLFLLLRREQETDPARRQLLGRLFWVLLVSERSHAIRYQRPATLQITPTCPGADAYADVPGLARLVALFRPLDTAFIAMLNNEDMSSTAVAFAAAYLERIDRAVDGALLGAGAGAGAGVSGVADLCDTQRANLHTTQLWLHIIVWQLRLRLGLLSSQPATSQQTDVAAAVVVLVPPSRTYHYPLAVAARLAAVARQIPLSSLRVHGAGLTEKLFDVACTIVDVLARVPSAATATAAAYRPPPPGTNNGDVDGDGDGDGDDDGRTPHRPEDDLQYLRQLVAQLPGGADLYSALLDKHILQTLGDGVSDSIGAISALGLLSTPATPVTPVTPVTPAG